MSKRGPTGGDELFKNLDKIARQRAATAGGPPLAPAPPTGPVVLVTPRWTDAIQTDPRPDPLGRVARTDAGWELAVRVPVRAPDQAPGTINLMTVTCAVRVGEPDVAMLAQPDGSAAPGVRCWGLRRLGPGTWLVAPSLAMPGVTAAFVVLCEVPEPAPFVDAPASPASEGKVSDEP